MTQNEGLHAANVARDRQKAEEWLNDNFGERRPYTQVMLDEDVAKQLAEVALREEVTIAEVARRFLYRGLSVPEQN